MDVKFLNFTKVYLEPCRAYLMEVYLEPCRAYLMEKPSSDVRQGNENENENLFQKTGVPLFS